MCQRKADNSHMVLTETWRGPRSVDACVAPIVAALNKAGVATTASCCGHGRRPGSIGLVDGRELLIMSFQQARDIDHLWPGITEDIEHETP